MHLAQDGGRDKWGRGGGSCEHVTEILGYIKCAQRGDQLRNFQNLKDFLLRSVGQSFSRSVGQSVSQAVSQSVRQTDRQTAHSLHSPITSTQRKQ